ncbi:hypothetical protein PAHAL_3G102400 [Panicum hallii]|jgi:hypothetical protein|uniref:Uncharacterized protein n=1 Tax=Panicum hallii TaxID=206008 RepID=A0A2T8KHT2_9POAL|nr:neurofilament medium polypeptide-like [Panicum hallii]PVH61719.1 hypothetical protein PAHAL_3G102400 [Panicum hallii]
MKPPAASPGRAEKPQLPAPAPPGLARLLLSKSRRGGRSRRAPATSPMFVSRGRSRAADGEPSSPKVTCIGQVRMRKGKKGAAAAAKAAAPEKGAKGYCRCLKKAFLCGGLFDFDSRKRRQKAPSPEVERARRSPWVFSSRDVAVAAVPKAADPRSGSQGEGHEDDEEEEMVVGVGVFGSIGREEGEKLGIGSGCGSEKEEEDGDDEREAQLVSSATTTPPKNALLLMRCRSAPQNRTSPLTSRFPAAPQAPVPVPVPVPSPSPTRDALAAVALEIAASPSPSPSPRKPERASPSPRKPSAEKAFADEDGVEKGRGGAAAAQEQDPHLIGAREEDDEEEEDDDEFEEEDEMRCSSARPLVLQRCKSEPATTAAAKMAAGAPGADATTAGCFWAHGGSSGRRRHAPSASGAPVALTGH